MKKLLIISLLFSLQFTLIAQENCNNGIDDDNDGLIDLFDDECDCNGFSSSQVVTSLIPNYSFENRSCCPSGYSQLNCADNWIQASNPTSDYWNSCSGSLGPGPPQPFPDGNGIVGFINMSGWQEYIGTCLSTTMTAGTSYNLNFKIGYTTTQSPAVDFVIYGTSNCANLPFNGSNCPIGIADWFELGRVTVGGSNTWEQLSMVLNASSDVEAIVMGGDCSSGTTYTYYYLDELILAETSLFSPIAIDKSGHDCQNNIVLTASTDTTGGTWQWYKDSIALPGETDSTLNISSNNYGNGEYQIKLTIGNKCELTSINLEPSIITFNTQSTPTCSNLDSGRIEAKSISGINIFKPFEFFINGVGPNLDSNFSNLSAGNYQIIIIDSNLCSDTVDVIVDSTPTPIANFSFDTVCIGNTTIFSDNSQINNGGIIDSWTWSIDGTTDINQNAGYTFSSVGPHDAELKVSSSNGCIDSISKEIVLHDLPSVDFLVQPGCQFSTIQFTNTTNTSGQPFSSNYIFNWNFDDGSSSTDDSPSHSFNSSSTFDISLTAVSDNFCVNDTTKQLIIHPKPIADFTSDSVCLGQTTSFIDLSSVSTGSINSWKWNIEALISSIQNPTYTFSNDGFFSVELISISDQGCEDTIQKEVVIHPLPIADFSPSSNQIDVVNNRVQFYNSSSGAINYLWLFDSIGQSSQVNPTFDFRIDIPCQSFENKLFAETEFGCIDSTIRVINSKGNLLFYVPNSFTPDKDGVNDFFKPVFTDLSDNDYSFQVFDRWGTILFETNDINSGWDGTHKGIPLKQDTYIWKINTKTVCEIDIDKFNGHITLIR